MAKGTIAYYDREAGKGRIKPKGNGAAEVSFRASAFHPASKRVQIEVGTEVVFRRSDKGNRATSVTLDHMRG